MSGTKRALNEAKQWEKLKDQPGYDNLMLQFNPDDMSKGHALIHCVNVDSPYYLTFFYFTFELPPNYPFQHPSYKFTSPSYFNSGLKNCRVHPNLYETGKVCLSILGTWSGEPWTPMLTNMTVLKMIEGILNSNPLTNEPGFEKSSPSEKQNINYTKISKFRSLTMLINMIEKFKNNDETIRNLPFKEWAIEVFNKNKEKYIKILESETDEKLSSFHGEEDCGFSKLLERLKKLI